MNIRIIAVGTKMPSWVNEGFDTYAKRIRGNWSLDLIEIPAEKRSKTSVISRLIEKEGEKVLALVKPDHYMIALEVKGKTWSTEDLALQLESWQQASKPIDLIIGGPDGLSAACRVRANILWSLSRLTLPHPLVRILVAEQLYRGISILQNHPYHRA